MRTYDSALAQAQASAGTPGSLGYGWTDNWNSSLIFNSGVVTVSQTNGATVTFHPPVSGACVSPYVGSGASGTYCALPDVTAALTYNSATSTYTFTTHPYQAYTYNSSGQLTRLAGPGGATVTLTYRSPAPGVCISGSIERPSGGTRAALTTLPSTSTGGATSTKATSVAPSSHSSEANDPLPQ
jgi:hypothetical protein